MPKAQACESPDAKSFPYMLRLFEKPFVCLPLILLIAFAVYSNTFDVPFQFDDEVFYNNVRPRNISNIPLMFTEFEGSWASRPLLYATLALNYHFGGFDTSGYHAVNLALHLMNSSLLYLLVTMTGRHLGYGDKDVRLTAVFSAALFALHPVQTEAVTYIVSRSMLLATAFYFSGLILFLRAITAERRRGLWIAGLFVVSLLGMASRENFATFPIMLVLYDLFFVSKFRLREAAGHWKAYLPVFLSLGYLAYIVVNNTYVKSTDSPGVGVPHADYFLTQFNVHWTYLRLLALPINQNIDYDYPMATTLFEFPTMLAFIGYLGLWAVAIVLARKRPVMSFSMLWFFIILMPISFGVTLMGLELDDVIFEHRFYLPGAGFIVAAASGAVIVLGKFWCGRLNTAAVAAAVIVPLVLAGAAYKRNTVWGNEMSLWADAAEKSPRKARPHNNLGVAYDRMGRRDMAMKEFRIALELKSDYALAHYNLGNDYDRTGRLDMAMEEYRVAIELKPDLINAHNNLGKVYDAMGNYDMAIEEYGIALELNPEYAMAHYNLGNTYFKTGRPDMAIEEFRIAIELKPDFAEAHYNLGIVYSASPEHREKAIEHINNAVRLKPGLMERLGAAGVEIGQTNNSRKP